MTAGRWKRVVQTWTGILAAAGVVVTSLVLLGAYVHARRVTPGEKAFVDSLKERARTDTEVQKILQPEFQRQHAVLVRRRKVYERGGIVLTVSVMVLLAWLKWLRPGRGEWAGLPGRITRHLEREPGPRTDPGTEEGGQ